MLATPAACYEIYTDGSCHPNLGVGGWGAVITSPNGTVHEIRGCIAFSTSNRAELTAAIESLRALPQGSVVRVFSDSTYVVRSCSAAVHRGVRRKRPNADLVRALVDAVRRHHSVAWCWVRGHAGNEGNTRAHKLANLGRRQIGI